MHRSTPAFVLVACLCLPALSSAREVFEPAAPPLRAPEAEVEVGLEVAVEAEAEVACGDYPEPIDAADPVIDEADEAGRPVAVADLLRGEVVYLRGEDIIGAALLRRATDVADAVGVRRPVARVVTEQGELDHEVMDDAGAIILQALRHSRCHDYGPTWATTTCNVNCGAETRTEADGSLRTYFVNKSPTVTRNKQCVWSDNPDDFCITERVDWCRIHTYADNQCRSLTAVAEDRSGFMCGQ